MIKTFWWKIKQLNRRAGHKMVALASRWLLKNDPPQHTDLCDFNKICQTIQPGDVLLVEGRSRVSQVIKWMTQSPWSHAMLYIGRLENIQDQDFRRFIQQRFSLSEKAQLLVESELGQGTVITALNKYAEDHIRILRPRGLSPEDAQKIIDYALKRLGAHYSLRHIIDLGQFLLPWHLFPKTWRARLLEGSQVSQVMEDICSSMIAEAFQTIQFPLLPRLTWNGSKQLELIERQSRLVTPRDFDFSPYFEIIKYPIFHSEERGYYHDLPWKKTAD